MVCPQDFYTAISVLRQPRFAIYTQEYVICHIIAIHASVQMHRGIMVGTAFYARPLITVGHCAEKTVQIEESGKRLLSGQTPNGKAIGTSRLREVALAGIENDLLHVLQNGIRVFTVEDEEKHESERTAEELTVFQIGIGAGIHHEQFGELLLRIASCLSGLGKTVGDVVAQSAFAGVFQWDAPLFRRIHTNLNGSREAFPWGTYQDLEVNS